MRVLALALLSTISFAVAAVAQPGPSYYTDRATQERAQNEANGDYHDYWDPPGQRVYDRSARDRDIQNREYQNREFQNRRDAQRYRDEQAYERGRRDAERERQNSGGSGNDIVNSIGRMFNNR